LFDAAAGINNHCSPVVKLLAVAVSVDANLAIESLVEEVVWLKLEFAEVNIAAVVGWQKYTIDAEAGFFDFVGVASPRRIESKVYPVISAGGLGIRSNNRAGDWTKSW
jgi:hypothetical protein